MLSFKQLDTMLLQWVDYFIPVPVKEQGWEDLRRARLIVGAICISILIAFFDAVVRVLYDSGVNIVIDVAMVLCFVVGGGLLRFTQSIRVAGIYICVNTLLLSAFADTSQQLEAAISRSAYSCL